MAVETINNVNSSVDINLNAEIEINPEKMVLHADSRYIYQPRFTSPDRSSVKALVRLPDGSLQEMEAPRADRNSPLIRDVFDQYSEAEIEMFTLREQCMNQKMNELQERNREDRKRHDQMAKLFEVKSEAMQSEVVQKCVDKSIGRKIRSAKSATEVYGLMALALMIERNASEPK